MSHQQFHAEVQQWEELLTAQAGSSPEDRMEEARIIKKIFRATRRDRITGGTVLQRLLRSVMFGASDCWYWVGSINRLGYGQFPALGESKAHRVSYRVFKGDIPKGLHVLHSCDTRCCVNPDHLRLGTHAENMAECAARGRVVVVRMFGEKNPMAKLSRAVVAQIRAAKQRGVSQASLARLHRVSPMTISRAVRGESWK